MGEFQERVFSPLAGWAANCHCWEHGIVVAFGRGSPTEADQQAVLEWLRLRPELVGDQENGEGEYRQLAHHGHGGLGCGLLRHGSASAHTIRKDLTALPRPGRLGSQSPFRPFCSERCRQIAGAWANESYRVPGAALPVEFAVPEISPTPRE